MKSNLSTKNKMTAMTPIALTLGLLVSLVLPVSAQESSGLGLDQDSLLPPEVVPLDPTAASKMMQNQAQQRAADMSSPSGCPAMSSPSSNTAPGGMTAQDFRKAMYAPYMNQSNAQPINLSGAPGLQAAQPAPGQQFGSPYTANNAPQQQPAQLGQSPLMNGNGAPAQTQTLSGGTQQPKVGSANKFRGTGHTLGSLAAVGGAVAVGTMMLRSGNPAGMMGAGLFGAGLMNYGLRNAFRF